MPANRPKKCRVCKKQYHPFKTMQVVCGPSCAYKLAQKKRASATAKAEKADRARLRARKRALMTIADHHRLAQAAVNSYIRERDRGKPCISCGQSNPDRQYHAGHYRPTTHGSVRYNVLQIRLQCSQCNLHKSGSQATYRPALAEIIGMERLEQIEADNRVMNWTREYLERLTKVFRRRARHLHALRVRLGVYE